MEASGSEDYANVVYNRSNSTSNAPLILTDDTYSDHLRTSSYALMQHGGSMAASGPQSINNSVINPRVGSQYKAGTYQPQSLPYMSPSLLIDGKPSPNNPNHIKHQRTCEW